MHSQNFESPKIHKLIQVSRSQAPGILARRIRLFVGGFPPKTESVFFKSFRFGMAVHEHKPTWQKKPSSQFSLDGQDWIPKESNSNHHQKAFWNSEIYFDWIHWIIIAFSTCHFIKYLSRGFSHVEWKKEISSPDVAWQKPLVEKVSAPAAALPRESWQVPRTPPKKTYFSWKWVLHGIETPLCPFNYSGFAEPGH